MISRLAAGPPGRRHSLLPDIRLQGRTSHHQVGAVDIAENESEDAEPPRMSEMAVNSQYSFSARGSSHRDMKRIHVATTNQTSVHNQEDKDVVDHSNSSESESEDDGILTINVGGRIFKTFTSTLLEYPETRLGFLAAFASKADKKSSDSKEFFFDRDPDLFSPILNFYRDGQMHVPRDLCVEALHREIEFWNLHNIRVSDCCRKYRDDVIGEIRLSEMMRDEYESIRPRRLKSAPEFLCTIKGRVWEFLDNPPSSLAAKIWFCCFYFFLIVSVVNVFVSSVPGCRVPVPDSFIETHNFTNSSSYENSFLMEQARTNPKIRRLLSTRPHLSVLILELLCVIYFSLEFCLRVAFCPARRKLFTRLMTWCDLLYLIPMWISLAFSAARLQLLQKPQFLPLKLTMQTLMVLRVLRLLTLARHYKALQVLILSIKASLREILLLFIFVMLAIVIFACIVYCVEIFRPDTFESLLTGLYWSLITMTTVGYGDIVPRSWLGYIVASLCALTGIIIIGMPVPIITSNFHLYYGYQNALDEEEEEGPTRLASRQGGKKKSIRKPIKSGNG